MSRIVWRWEEKDLGFRFRGGSGKQAAEYYQADSPGDFYVVPRGKRKLSQADADRLAAVGVEPPGPRVVANPWRSYDRDWDWIASENGICINWAGCLDRQEIERREDEGVQRAMDMVAEQLGRPEPVPITVGLVQKLHAALFDAIYPFAGQWRTVALHKGEGPTRWPLPPCGIAPLMDDLERQMFSRSPVISDDDDEVFHFVGEVMAELIAVHPFREGNGRTAFIVGNLLLMQNQMLPLSTWERRQDEARYLAACERGRIHKDYAPMATLIAEWEDRAVARWEAGHE